MFGPGSLNGPAWSGVSSVSKRVMAVGWKEAESPLALGTKPLGRIRVPGR